MNVKYKKVAVVCKCCLTIYQLQGYERFACVRLIQCLQKLPNLSPLTQYLRSQSNSGKLRLTLVSEGRFQEITKELLAASRQARSEVDAALF